ncbi:MAG: 23S rRNA (adenine(2503)-C(2))-methyltransferase RlmN [Ndongobacter sp.]|nr:23S rRNA (adenine(2503)-C(2))-methyltransferase RlmN [Ndongobacter sp.]
MQRALNALSVSELTSLMKQLGYPAFRARQLFRFFHAERKLLLSEAQVLPKTLRDALADRPIRTAEVVYVRQSQLDGTKKFLLKMEGEAIIETVFMPYEDRNTLCVSTQIGCRMGCKFCASTKAAFVRNLQAEEILAEIYVVERETGCRIDNIVLMGIGEPLDNYDEVMRFLRLVSDPLGKNLSLRSITLSTCGLTDRIDMLAEEGLPINLAISLHSTSDERRRRTMPIANKHPMNELLAACARYFEKTSRRVSFEYVLIRGENDRPQDLAWLAQHLRGAGNHINLIALNEIREYDGMAVQDRELEQFQKQLEKRGVHATIRRRRGIDIDGACGQLRIDFQQRTEQ